MKLRALTVVTAAILALALGASSVSPADGQPTQGPHTGGISTPVDCTIAGVPETCTLTVTSFTVVNGTLTAVGTVTGGGITVPFQAPAQADGTCQILDLTLGPLHLDLLGLVVDLDTVHLEITAEQGPGKLLGNLLCAIAGLLDQGSPTALQQIVNLLNQILAAL
jgi:hypothetical protein